MSKAGLVTALVTMASAFAGAATLTVDRVKQRYPWNGLVDIDYVLSEDAAAAMGLDDSLEVSFVDRDAAPAVTNRAFTFLQTPLPLKAGRNRITWNANADGYTFKSDRIDVMLDVVHGAEEYMVIDVSSGSSSKTYPVTYMHGAPVAGFDDDQYRGDKIVLRRINPGAFIEGSPSTENGRNASIEKQQRIVLTKPYWIGIYEITQKQWNKVKNTDPSTSKGEYRPVEHIRYNLVRGGDWPSVAVPDSSGSPFLYLLNQRCKSADADGKYTVPVTGFDLPTEAQWEYACRAGSTGAFYSETPQDDTTAAAQEAQLNRLGRYKSDQSDAKGGYSSNHTVVGKYAPNAFGLYDMHGNVWELCRDTYLADRTTMTQKVEPIGNPTASHTHTSRGGAYGSSVDKCRSASRWGVNTNDDQGGKRQDNVGFRIGRFE